MVPGNIVPEVKLQQNWQNIRDVPENMRSIIRSVKSVDSIYS